MKQILISQSFCSTIAHSHSLKLCIILIGFFWCLSAFCQSNRANHHLSHNMIELDLKAYLGLISYKPVVGSVNSYVILENTVQIDYSYQQNINEPKFESQFSTRGSYLSFSVGLTYSFGSKVDLR